MLGTIGTDVNTGIVRFAFGAPNLEEGVNLVAVAVGLFAFSETGSRLASPEVQMMVSAKIRSLIPSLQEVAVSIMPIIRGCTVGSIVGIFPGTGPLLASFASYALEKRVSKHPEKFGTGMIEGVAGPEASNNAATLTHMIPMLTLGIPAGAANALLLSALLIQGITPGPDVVTKHPDLFWGVIASMLVGNVMLLILNLPMVGIWIRLLMIPYRFMYPAILAFCCIGVYSVNNAAFDVVLAAGVGAAGYFFKKLNCSPAPTILGLVLGPLLEENFRRSMQLSRGDPMVFFERPISLFLLVLSAILVIVLTRITLRQDPAHEEGIGGESST
jgi:TctA family transporter